MVAKEPYDAAEIRMVLGTALLVVVWVATIALWRRFRH